MFELDQPTLPPTRSTTRFVAILSSPEHAVVNMVFFSMCLKYGVEQSISPETQRLRSIAAVVNDNRPPSVQGHDAASVTRLHLACPTTRVVRGMLV
jgi:hypothetical protein